VGNQARIQLRQARVLQFCQRSIDGKRGVNVFPPETMIFFHIESLNFLIVIVCQTWLHTSS